MSCLFDSLSYFLNYTGEQIRQKICDYLEENRPIIEGVPTDLILGLEDDNYIKKMRRRNEWGSAVEITAACNIWKLRIIVHNIRGGQSRKIEFIPVNKTYIYTINISWNGYHYEPLK